MIPRAQSYPSKEGKPGSHEKGPKHKTIDIDLCQRAAVRLLQMWSKENHFQSIYRKAANSVTITFFTFPSKRFLHDP